MNDLNTSFLIETNIKENEKKSMSMPTTPTKTSSMAFTVDFDDLNNNNMLNSNKKKLGIRDSIRKFAPPKPETIEKIRVKCKEQNSNSEKFINNSIQTSTYTNLSSKLSNSVKKTNKLNTRLNDGATFLIQRMLYSEPNSLQSNQSEEQEVYSMPVKLSNTITRQKDSNLLNSQTKEKLSSINSFKYSPKSYSFRSPSTNEMDSGVCDDDKSDDREYNESLLQLKQQQEHFFKNNDLENILVDLNKQEENEQEIDDNVSETGTYTVGLDNVDPIAEQARKRINEIFDENKKSTNEENLSNSESSSDCNFSKENLRDNNKSSNTFNLASLDAIHKIYANKSKVNSSVKAKNDFKKDSTFNKPKNRSLPSNSPVLNHKSFGNTTLNKAVNQQINNSNEKLNETSNKQVRQNQVLNKKNHKTQFQTKNNLIKQTKNSNINQNINLINQNNTYVFNCNNQANLLLKKSKNNNLVRDLNRNNQKVDNYKNSSNNVFEDTVSLKSEEVSTAGSTDLSSLGSEKCKSDSLRTSTMRFNRAFALRRARLGIETPSYPLSNCKNIKQLSSSRSSVNTITKQTNQNKQVRKSSVSSMPENTFNRTDGGRFSLRASKLSNNNLSERKLQNLSSIPCAISSPNHSLNSNRIKNVKNQNFSLQRPNSVNYFNKQTSNSDSLNETNICYPNSSAINNSHHVRAYSFDATNLSDLSNYKYKSNSSSATISNASTSEDLSNLTDTMNIKSLQRLSPFQLGRRIYSTKPHYMAQTNSFRTKLEESNLSNFHNENINSISNSNNYQSNSNNFSVSSSNQSKINEISTSSQFINNNSNTNKNFNSLNVKSSFSNNINSGKCLSALDYLVLSAVHQLSFKLRCKLRAILDAEKNKYPVNNENRILIEELLPQVNIFDYRNSEMSDKTISRDLSNILKNLKRIEQSLEVVNLLLESNSESIDRTNNEIFSNGLNVKNSTGNNNVEDVSSPIVDVNFFSVDI